MSNIVVSGIVLSSKVVSGMVLPGIVVSGIRAVVYISPQTPTTRNTVKIVNIAHSH